jgi:hypothetical protein
MKVDCALLCDAVTVREGLLHILGGGVTRVRRPHYPHSIDVELALRLLVHPTETDAEHRLQVRLLDADGREHARIDAKFKLAETGEIRPGEMHSMCVPLPVRTMQIADAGDYSFELLIDNVHQASVPFTAEILGKGPSQ